LQKLFGPQGNWVPRATTEDFECHSPKASLLHFFGHGSFQWSTAPHEHAGVPQGGEAKLFFWDRPLSNRSIQQRHPARQLKPCAVLTLAACSVGRVDYHSRFAAREIVGLQAALFEREVPAFIGALWPAHSGPALAFFESFYSHFAPAVGTGKSRIDAFHAAQK